MLAADRTSETLSNNQQKTGGDYNSPQTERVNPGNFKRGPDPRRHIPGGPITQFRAELSTLCGQQTHTAVTFLIDTMNDENAPLKLRMAACTEILDRGHGKAVSRDVLLTVDASVKADSPIDVLTATDEQLNQLVSDALSAPDPIETVIDAELIEHSTEK